LDGKLQRRERKVKIMKREVSKQNRGKYCNSERRSMSIGVREQTSQPRGAKITQVTHRVLINGRSCPERGRAGVRRGVAERGGTNEAPMKREKGSCPW